MAKLCVNIEQLSDEHYNKLLVDMERTLLNAIADDTPLHVSWSGGKDSTATVILLHEIGAKNVHISTVDIMYNDKISAVPEMQNFKEQASETFKKWGYTVDFIKHPTKTYESEYVHVITKSKVSERNGKIQGAPIMGMCRFTGLKQALLKKISKQYGDCIEVLGIASDEQQRFNRKHFDGGNYISILAITHTTELMAKDLCRKYNLLSPFYDTGYKRDGCFFCPYSSIKQIKYRASQNPDVFRTWKEFLKLHLNDEHSSYSKKGNPNFNAQHDIVDIINAIEEVLP